MSGEKYLAQLKENGELPGVGPQTHGQLNSIPQTMSSLFSNAGPQTIEWYFIPTNNTNIFFSYKIQRKDKESAWELTGASEARNGGTNSIDILKRSK